MLNNYLRPFAVNNHESKRNKKKQENFFLPNTYFITFSTFLLCRVVSFVLKCAGYWMSESKTFCVRKFALDGK